MSCCLYNYFLSLVVNATGGRVFNLDAPASMGIVVMDNAICMLKCTMWGGSCAISRTICIVGIYAVWDCISTNICLSSAELYLFGYDSREIEPSNDKTF